MQSLTCDDLKKVTAILDRYSPEIDTAIRIGAEEFKQRQRNVQQALADRGLDVGVFYWYREMPGDGIYVTGYAPTIERASGLIAPQGRPMILAGPEAGKLAEDVGRAKGVDVAFVEDFAIPDEYYEAISYRSLKELIPEVAGRAMRKVGLLTSLELIPHKLLETFRQAAGHGAEFVEADDILADLRYEKSEAEFACMAQADKIACAAARAMLAVLRPGLRESQVAAVGDFVMKSLGAEGYGVETVFNSGPRCRTVIGPASNEVIQAGQIVQFGCSPSYEGYKGILRRAAVVGKPTDRQRRFFDVMNEAFACAEAALRDVVEKDLEPRLIDLAARDYFAGQEIDGLNMKQFHTYSSAHGTGLTECLEPMVVGPDTTTHYGNRVGIMLDIGCYGHPNDEIAGGCVEDAFGKDGSALLKWSDLPAAVDQLVGKI